MVDGYSNKEIAQHCHIEENTVKHHLSNIFDKLGVSTRLELALFAVNHLRLKTITRVSFVSNPAGADIEVDGKFLGSTPAELPLALGLRTIRVSKKGFKPYQRTVQVLSGGAQRISVDLEPGWQNCFCCGSGTDCRCSTRPLGQGQEAKGRFNCDPQTYHASVGPFKDRSSTESPLGEVEEGPEEGLTLSVMETLPRPKYSWRRNRDGAGKMRHCQAEWE